MLIRNAALAGASWLAFAGAAHAQEAVATRDATAERIAQLEAHLAELEAQIEDLKESTAADSADVRRIQSDAPQVTLANGRPTIATADGQSRFAIRAVVQYDLASYSQDDPSTPDNRRSDASNPADLNSGGNFRRARLGIEGTINRDWSYALTGEFGGTGSEAAQLNQAYVEYAGWKPWETAAPVRFRIGAWATPAGLEDATSNTDSLFLERAAAAELVRSIAAGDGRSSLGVFANGDRWYGSGVLTGGVVGNTGEFDEQSGYILRAAFLPLRGTTYGVHVGGAITGVIDPADTNAGPLTTQAFRLRERPELRVDGERFVDTGTIPSDGLTTYGLELGGFWNNFYAAGEVFQIDLQRSDGLPDPSFGGWYAQAAWTITGERRRWNAANGGFSGIRPDHAFDLASGQWGAWELAARHSVLNLNDNEGAQGTAPISGAVRGGEQNVTTIGLNWYPNNVVRFLLDYQWVEIDRLDPENTTTTVTAVPGFGAQIGQDFQAISLRTQVAF